MIDITLIDHLAMRLDIPRSELKNPARMVEILNELLVVPAGLYPVVEWNITVSYLYRDHYYFSSIERAKTFVQEELEKRIPKITWRNTLVRLSRAWAVPIICGLAVIILMQHVFMFCFVPSASMEPTINEGSFIFAFRLYGVLDVGDIVVFDRDGILLVKRIAAAPGDTVYLNDETGGYSLAPMDESTRELVVPAGCFFVVGDNEENSLDSRFWEQPFVLQKELRAKVPI